MQFSYKLTRRRLTKNQKENVRNSRDLCPKCGSDNISDQDIFFMGSNTIRVVLECEDCTKVWVEQFKFEKPVETKERHWVCV